jgi:hypothetical protein
MADLITLYPNPKNLLIVGTPFKTMTLLNYESSGKNDDQQNKENQDKSNMMSKSTTNSNSNAHSYSLLSNRILIFYYFISEMLG